MSTSTSMPHALPEIQLLQPAELLHSTATEWGSSRYAERQRCTEAYDLRYNRRILPIYRPSYFGIGSLVHAGIRQVEQGAALGLELDWRAPLAAAREQAEQRAHEMNVLDEAELELPEGAGYGLAEIAEAERILGAYWARWGLENAGWPLHYQIVALELQLSTSVFGEPLTGAIDTLLLNRDSGALMIVDTKTDAARVSLDEDKRERWRRGQRLRPQFLMQSAMLQELLQLDEPAYFTVNHLSKAKLPICERIPLDITQRSIDQWAENQRAIALEARRGFVPLRNYAACAPGIGAQCAYIDWCDGTEQSRSSRFRQDQDQNRMEKSE